MSRPEADPARTSCGSCSPASTGFIGSHIADAAKEAGHQALSPDASSRWHAVWHQAAMAGHRVGPPRTRDFASPGCRPGARRARGVEHAAVESAAFEEAAQRAEAPEPAPSPRPPAKAVRGQRCSGTAVPSAGAVHAPGSPAGRCAAAIAVPRTAFLGADLAYRLATRR
ncbi:hypothetical protein ACFPN7_25575 [Amycolatopsis halotolerans]|uniref:hypothetical protein n=1 Tax=Amycolatopsis halotolerans TaxID=330083 RepID=UPI00360F8284